VKKSLIGSLAQGGENQRKRKNRILTAEELTKEGGLAKMGGSSGSVAAKTEKNLS